jgi:hypothetical protein
MEKPRIRINKSRDRAQEARTETREARNRAQEARTGTRMKARRESQEEIERKPGSNQGVGKSGSTLSQNLIYNPGPSGFVLVGFTPSVMAGN